MSQVLVRELDLETVAALKMRAKENARSLESELRSILEDMAFRDERRAAAIAFANDMAKRSGRQLTDSVQLIREDRDR